MLHSESASLIINYVLLFRVFGEFSRSNGLYILKVFLYKSGVLRVYRDFEKLKLLTRTLKITMIPPNRIRVISLRLFTVP